MDKEMNEDMDIVMEDKDMDKEFDEETDKVLDEETDKVLDEEMYEVDEELKYLSNLKIRYKDLETLEIKDPQSWSKDEINQYGNPGILNMEKLKLSNSIQIEQSLKKLEIVLSLREIIMLTNNI